jgi:TonB family protein
MLPYMMLYTVIAGVPSLLGAFGVAALLRHYGKSERGVWLGALVLAFMVPVVSLIDPVASTPATEPAPMTGVIGLPEVVAVPVPDASLDAGRLLVALWIFASLLMALRWVVAMLRLGWQSRAWRADTLDGVPVLLTDDVGPAVSGVLRPRVLAPTWLADLPARERALILMHEEEHVRARDPMVVAVARAARVVAPWNPVVWLLTARLIRAVELDCDRRVLKRSSDVAAYGHTLIKMSARRPSRLVAAAAFAESEAPLRGRILSMTTPSRTISVAAIAAATILGVVLLVGSLGIPVPVVSINVAVGSQPDQTPTVTAFDAPPTPPPPPPPPIDHHAPPPSPVATPEAVTVISQVPRTELVLYRGADGEPTSYRVEPAQAAPIEQPSFTPMSVRPQLMNIEAVQQTLMREYPATLRDAGIGGAPVLWIHIDAQGAVDDTRVHETSGYEALDEAAMNVARAMQFSPALNRDQRVPVWVQIPIRFQTVN